MIYFTDKIKIRLFEYWTWIEPYNNSKEFLYKKDDT